MRTISVVYLMINSRVKRMCVNAGQTLNGINNVRAIVLEAVNGKKKSDDTRARWGVN